MLTKKAYLTLIRRKAKQAGYNPKKVFLSEDGIHKVTIITPSGETRSFGRVGYGDYIIYSYLEAHGQVPEGTAAKKRHVFRVSHEALARKYQIMDKYAPNTLALAILW